ncbi:Rv3235 family protein [Streptomyces oceani]|uniref:Uncharacterized protein n=1 Tax=Streptomyces oceani TaxID=1075402 RepID=A0A1E7KGS0_9ACTN|nr:Rv3235 family protein [Streptomyces oceani]OEV03034.1 hypothetical protein AN216_13395 [Streptomyces oceani]
MGRLRAEDQPHHWFAQQLLLVLSGQRPAHALLRYVRGAAYDELYQLASRKPLRPSGADRSAPALLGVGGQRPAAGVIEVFARVAVDRRPRAMAFRLELCEDLRWRCAALELDGQR